MEQKCRKVNKKHNNHPVEKQPTTFHFLRLSIFLLSLRIYILQHENLVYFVYVFGFLLWYGILKNHFFLFVLPFGPIKTIFFHFLFVNPFVVFRGNFFCKKQKFHILEKKNNTKTTQKTTQKTQTKTCDKNTMQTYGRNKYNFVETNTTS